jgi:hypothetical protein
MMRFKSAFAVALTIFFFATVGIGLGQGKPLKRIRVGVPSVGMGNIITFVIKEGRLFEKYGLEAEVITVMGSGIGSKAHQRQSGRHSHRYANGHSGQSCRSRYGDPGAHHACSRSRLMVRPDLKAGRSEGQKIGVSSLGSLTDFWSARSRKERTQSGS